MEAIIYIFTFIVGLAVLFALLRLFSIDASLKELVRLHRDAAPTAATVQTAPTPTPEPVKVADTEEERKSDMRRALTAMAIFIAVVIAFALVAEKF